MPYPAMPKSPLAQRTFLVACSAKKMQPLLAGIQSMGGKTIPFPVIEVREIQDKEPLDKALRSLKDYAWIIFTSAYGAEFFLQHLNQSGIRLRPEDMPRICAIGPATAREVRACGYAVELIPEAFVAEGLVEALARYHGGLEMLAGRRVLIPRALEAREVLPEALIAAGVAVDVVPCYETVCAEPTPEIVRQLRSAKPDMLLFTSPSSVRGFAEILGKEDAARMLMESAVAVLGPITKSTVAAYGKSAEVSPRENTVESLLEAIGEFYSAAP